MRNPRRNLDPTVERLRFLLIAAITGAAAAAPACAGKSQHTPGGEAGDGSGGTTGGSGGSATGGSATGGSTTGGSGGKGTGGSATGGSATGGSGGSSATGGSGGVITPAGGVGGVGGATGGKGGAGPGGMGGVAGEPPEGCAAATSYSPTLERCEGGFVHRPTKDVCPVPPEDGLFQDAGAPLPGGCTIDADCSERANGRCVVDNPLPEVATAIYCVYSCETDADCDAGYVCSCESTFVSNGTMMPLTLGLCRPASCGTDGDCEDGALCISPVDAFCGTPRPEQYHCQTPADECSGPEDCIGGAYCSYQVDHHACLGRPACGRPFLIGGEERLAPLSDGLGWSAELEPSGLLATLDAEQRAAVARHFAEAALMEHASIAAFARFSLQLLALGAPSDLVADTARAMADETRHARLCFGLAERYGHTAAPGKLDVTGALGEVDLLGIVELVTLEGCIGESGAALEAAWAAEAASDPVVKAALAGIAEDEARHAALAFRFVAWAAKQDARVLPRVRALVAAATVGTQRNTERPRGNVLEAHGVLDLATRNAARRAALHDVIPAALDGLDGATALPRPLELA